MNSSSAATIGEPSIEELTEQPCAIVHLSIPTNDIARHMDPAVQELLQVISDEGLQPTGPMFTYHHQRPAEIFNFDIGFPIQRAIDPKGRVKNSMTPGGRAARTLYEGSYQKLGGAWAELRAWAEERNLRSNEKFLERYLTNPNEVPDPEKHVTELNWMIADEI